MYRYILRESCSQFDSLPLTYLLTMPIVEVYALRRGALARRCGRCGGGRCSCGLPTGRHLVGGSGGVLWGGRGAYR